MIECGGGPVRRAMTHLTLLREPGRNVIRIVRPLVILQMATHASGGADVVVPVEVTLSALHLDVRPG